MPSDLDKIEHSVAMLAGLIGASIRLIEDMEPTDFTGCRDALAALGIAMSDQLTAAQAAIDAACAGARLQ